MITIPKKNIIKFVLKHFPDGKIVSSGEEYKTNCIFHSDSSNHLYINLSKGVYNCFSCGEKGTFFNLVKVVSPKQKLVITEEKEDFSIEEEVKNENFSLPEGVLYFDRETRYSKIALDYLLSRGITEEEIYYYKLGYCIEGICAGRIIVPVFDLNNNLVSYVARDYTGNQKPKVLTPPGNGTQGVKRFIFNLHNASKTKKLYIGEGVFDSIALGVSGVALFGKAITRNQISQIVRVKPLEIVICLDPDVAQYDIDNLANKLYNYCYNIKIAKFPKGEDPSSIGKEACKKIIAEAVSVNYQMRFYA